VDVGGEDGGVAGVVGVDARNGDERGGGGLGALRGGGGADGGRADGGGEGGAADDGGGERGWLLESRWRCPVQRPLDDQTFADGALGAL
jgi:hypothetical protein